jgi:hypothetical protein
MTKNLLRYCIEPFIKINLVMAKIDMNCVIIFTLVSIIVIPPAFNL